MLNLEVIIELNYTAQNTRQKLKNATLHIDHGNRYGDCRRRFALSIEGRDIDCHEFIR